jgi:hypothetical protein
MAKITPPFDRATLRSILVQTVVASGCRQGSLRYWLSAGLGGFGLSSNECDKSTFYAVVIDIKYKGPEGVKVISLPVFIIPHVSGDSCIPADFLLKMKCHQIKDTVELFFNSTGDWSGVGCLAQYCPCSVSFWCRVSVEV